MKKKDNRFVRIIHSDYTNLIMGILLVLCGLFELFQDTVHNILGIRIGAHHGIIIFGLFQVVNALIAIVQGHQYMFEKVDKENG